MHLLVRLLVGAISIAGERLFASLAEWDARDPRPTTSDGATTMAHVLVGAMVVAPRLALRRASDARIWCVRVLGPGADSFARAVSESRLGAPLTRKYRRLRMRTVAACQQLGSTGRAEELRGRALALFALDEFLKFWLEQAAESPEVQQVIREQSVGLSQLAVDAVREEGAHADDAIESFVRRVLHLPWVRYPSGGT